MTKVVTRLWRYQMFSDSPIYFADYPRESTTDYYVSKICGLPREKIFHYLIKSVGFDREIAVFAPSSYRWLENEFEKRTKDRGYYIPPIEFLTDYLFPQMAHSNWSKPAIWDLSGHCTSVFVKDLDGEYI